MLRAARRTPGRSRRARQSLRDDRGAQPWIVGGRSRPSRPWSCSAVCWHGGPRPASWYAGGNIRAGCARSSSRPRPPYDRGGPATVIAERRPHARADFGPSVASAPA